MGNDQSVIDMVSVVVKQWQESGQIQERKFYCFIWNSLIYHTFYCLDRLNRLDHFNRFKFRDYWRNRSLDPADSFVYHAGGPCSLVDMYFGEIIELKLPRPAVRCININDIKWTFDTCSRDNLLGAPIEFCCWVLPLNSAAQMLSNVSQMKSTFTWTKFE